MAARPGTGFDASFSRPPSSTKDKPITSTHMHPLCGLVRGFGCPPATCLYVWNSVSCCSCCKITKRLNHVTNHLFLQGSLKINPTFNFSLLKQFLSCSLSPIGTPLPPPQIVGGQPAYMVYRILDSWQCRDPFSSWWTGKAMALRSAHGVLSNFLDPELIRKFHLHQPDRHGKSVRSRFQGRQEGDPVRFLSFFLSCYHIPYPPNVPILSFFLC